MGIEIDREQVFKTVGKLKDNKHEVYFTNVTMGSFTINNVPCIKTKQNTEEILLSGKTLNALVKMISKYEKEVSGITTLEYTED